MATLDHRHPTLPSVCPRVLLLSRQPSPDPFTALRTARLSNERFVIELALGAAEHLLRFHHGRGTACELLLQPGRRSPQRPALELPINVDREHESVLEGVLHLLAVQSEHVAPHDHDAVLNELLADARAQRALTVRFGPGDRGVSGLCVECRRTEAHIESFHLTPSDHRLLRTNSIFELDGAGASLSIRAHTLV